jgi:hypothetical protein
MIWGGVQMAIANTAKVPGVIVASAVLGALLLISGFTLLFTKEGEI